MAAVVLLVPQRPLGHRLRDRAVRLVQRAHAQGLLENALVKYVKAQPEVTALDSWQAEALDSLLALWDGISVGEGRWINGKHRAQAMIDAGVRHTVLTQLEYPDTP